MAGLTELHLCEFSQRPPALSWAAGNGVQEEAGGNVGRCPEGGGSQPQPPPHLDLRVLCFKGPQGSEARRLGAGSPTAALRFSLKPTPWLHCHPSV